MSGAGGVFFFVLLVIALTAIAFMIGRERGRDDIREEQERDSAQAEKDRETIDKDVQSRPDEQLDKDLDPWHRD